VILNPRSCRGTAAARYEAVRAAVEDGFAVTRVLLDDRGAWCRALVRAHEEGVERVVAVGGDGTVNAVCHAMLSNRFPAHAMELGAVGLGSSNDFHKPARAIVSGIPLRIGVAERRDVGLATWEDESGRTRRRWFCVSGSIGLTARANVAYSRNTGFVAWLSKRSVDAAIALAAIQSLLVHTDVPARLCSSVASSGDVSLTNLSVMLTPYLAGVFRYDASILPGGGNFAVHLCEGLSRGAILRVMARLWRGRFGRTAGTSSWSAPHVSAALAAVDDLELDGELFRARSVRFELVPEALAVCE
jgi:diacylglycerol kinase family enzyme